MNIKIEEENEIYRDLRTAWEMFNGKNYNDKISLEEFTKLILHSGIKNYLQIMNKIEKKLKE